ncbi:hypothetical protein LPJ38_33995 [Bradyrhizobium daqingense]|uniref:Uncharacterized protein n=1 Tax=Bradyrhizobium daqingense TaxID=993502 RepID=A0A562KZM0_9BRAD|nr:hypothetical protein [Bradyrhizobium daqingense]TWI00851.1 hypothetical protein IQ17_04854 [Bradyrhizobium daqingense]UFS88587.1 hypothetical protein LPJ38_33995 [Bradyrhizobium daqingense]
MVPRYPSKQFNLSILQGSLLITESTEAYACLEQELAREIQPKNIVEKIFLADVAACFWEMMRLRRCRDHVINFAFGPAISEVLDRVLGLPETAVECEARAALEREWFTKREARREVAKRLAAFQLDEGAIEAAAISSQADQLERLDRMISAQQARLHRAFDALADYREAFAVRVRTAVERATDQSGLAQLPARQKAG